MLLIIYHIIYIWKQIVFKPVSVFHKLTLKLLYNPIIVVNRKFVNISDFVDIILILYYIIFSYIYFLCTLEKMPEITQSLKRNISLIIPNTSKKFHHCNFFFQSESNEYDIVQICKFHSITVVVVVVY